MTLWFTGSGRGLPGSPTSPCHRYFPLEQAVGERIPKHPGRPGHTAAEGGAQGLLLLLPTVWPRCGPGVRAMGAANQIRQWREAGQLHALPR